LHGVLAHKRWFPRIHFEKLRYTSTGATVGVLKIHSRIDRRGRLSFKNELAALRAAAIMPEIAWLLILVALSVRFFPFREQTPSSSFGPRAQIQASITPSAAPSGVTTRVGCTYNPCWAA
jgi:hypothetical protein